jgi:predicted N-formylglutamate amidohydrolase
MIEIRNDLIGDAAGQRAMAERLSMWVAAGS